MAITTLAALSMALVQPDAVFTLDPSQTRIISPYVYGTNFPDWKALNTKFPFVRQGGNRMTAYNWETNASNAGSDWHHQNDDLMGRTDEPGWAARTFFQPAQAQGAAVLLTVPTLGYVAADKKGDGDVNKTPNYLSVRFLKSYPRKPGKLVYPPNAKDKAVYQDEYAAWVEKTRSRKTPVWFALDNEADIWSGTHARIMPKNPGYAWIIKNNIDYASAIKSAAPRALVFGPASYGWQGFRAFQDAADARGRDFLDTYLEAMKAEEKKTGKRILDVLDIHFYPEARGGDVRITENNGIKPATCEARMQAARSLWDPSYVEDSWITKSLGGKAIELLPRVMGQIARHYPGTKLAITEYNYGGGAHWSGMAAQADVLGVYGRYGLFAAANWGLEPRDTAILAGFRAFLNYDGKGGRFGSQGLGVKGGKAESDSLYASVQGRTLTVVAVNKTASSRVYKVKGGRWTRNPRGYAAQPDRPFQPAPITVKAVGGSLEFTVPAHGVVTAAAER